MGDRRVFLCKEGDMHQEDNAGKANVSLAAFYAVSAGLFGWGAPPN